MGAVPIHQLAVWFSVSAVSATANATGLKMCLRSIARIYLEAIAHSAAQPRNQRSCKPPSGVMINARIRAEMYADSTLTGT